MSVPTLYFPDIPYSLFREGRQHSTETTEGPSGRIQARIKWTRPKRRMTATLLGVGGSQYSVSSTTFKTLRKFLTLLHGRHRNFYIFDPNAADYDQEEPEAEVGLFDTTFPMVVPMKGGTITAVYDDGVIMGGAITQDSGGTGGEKRIVTVGGGVPADGSIISVEITGAKQRIPARLATDYDDFQFDFSAALPPVVYSLDLEEDFG